MCLQEQIAIILLAAPPIVEAQPRQEKPRPGHHRRRKRCSGGRRCVVLKFTFKVPLSIARCAELAPCSNTRHHDQPELTLPFADARQALLFFHPRPSACARLVCHCTSSFSARFISYLGSLAMHLHAQSPTFRSSGSPGADTTASSSYVRFALARALLAPNLRPQI